jgi:hypothetical protein
MSTDLYVYGPRVATPAEIAHAVSDAGCLLVPDVAGWWCEFPGPVEPLHSFEISSGDTEPSEDVAPVVMHVLHALGAGVSEPGVHVLTLPAASSDSWDLMAHVAAGIADRIGGLVCDPFDNTVTFPEGFADVGVPVAAGVRVDTLNVSWYGSALAEGPGWATRILRAAQRTFPEAMPAKWRRWEMTGLTKPVVLRRDDFADFESAATVAQISWTGTPPFFGGGLSRVTNAAGNKRTPYPPPFSDLHMSLNAAAVDEPHRRDQLNDLVVAVAEEMRAVYAHAQRSQNMLYRDGKILSDNASAPAGYQFEKPVDGIWGLPPSGVWLEWFGPPYLPYVNDALAGISQHTESGLLAVYGHDNDLRASRIPTELMQGPRGTRATVIPNM